jgi:acetyl-CoA synthetase
LYNLIYGSILPSILKMVLFTKSLEDLYEWAKTDHPGFWESFTKYVEWFGKWHETFSWDLENYRFTWFAGGRTNICYNCLDRHVRDGRAGKPAIVWWSEGAEQRRVITYGELHRQVSTMAGMLRALGVEKGDRVGIYMSMVPEALMTMLAATRIGVVHVNFFSGFGVEALARRLTEVKPKVVVTADVAYRRGRMIELKRILDEALITSGYKCKVLVNVRSDVNRSELKEERDMELHKAIEELGHPQDCVQMESNEPAFINFTSGTTGRPKGIVHVHGGYQVGVIGATLMTCGMASDDVNLCLSDIGWIGGTSYAVYAPLMVGCTTVIYEGAIDHPDAGVLWRIVERERVTLLWTSPTAIRIHIRYGPEPVKDHDLSSLRLVLCGGEVLTPPVRKWFEEHVLPEGAVLVDHMGQTEAGCMLVTYPFGVTKELKIKPGACGFPLPGMEVRVVREDGRPVSTGEKGEMILEKPIPSLTPTIWSDHVRYVEEYWSKYKGRFRIGDLAFVDEEGYFYLLGRADETIKVSGHRIGAPELESVIAGLDEVAEVVVVGVPDSLRGEVPVAFVVLRSGYLPNMELERKIVDEVRRRFGAIADLRRVYFVNALPKTRTGKLMRSLVRALVRGPELPDYSNIEDESVVEELKRVISGKT